MKTLIRNILVASCLSLAMAVGLSAVNQTTNVLSDPFQTLVCTDVPYPPLHQDQIVSVLPPLVGKADVDRFIVLTLRAYDIQSMAVSAMGATERRALRKELRYIKNELNAGDAFTPQRDKGLFSVPVGAIAVLILLISASLVF